MYFKIRITAERMPSYVDIEDEDIEEEFKKLELAVGAEVADNWAWPMEQLGMDKEERPTVSMAKVIADLHARGCSGAAAVHRRHCCHCHLYPRHQSLPCQCLSYHDH